MIPIHFLLLTRVKLKNLGQLAIEDLESEQELGYHHGYHHNLYYCYYVMIERSKVDIIVLRTRNIVKFKSDNEKWRSNGGETSQDRGSPWQFQPRYGRNS